MRISKYILFIVLVYLSFPVFADTMADSVNCRHSLTLDWVNTVGSDTLDAVTGVCADASGNVYVTGYFKHSLQVGSENLVSAGGKDIFIIKYDADGNVLWKQRAGGENDDYSTAIACNNDGQIFITGMFKYMADFAGHQLFGYELEDGFIVSYDSEGNWNWAQPVGGWGNDYCTDVKTDVDGNVVFTGTFNASTGIGSSTLIGTGGDDCFVAKFKKTGSFLWARNIGSVGNDRATAIAIDESGNVFISGVFTGSLIAGTQTYIAEGNVDGFFAAYASDGTFKWAQQVGTPGNNDVLNDLAADKLGNIYVTGAFDHDDQPVFIRKFDYEGNEIWTKLTGGDSDAVGLAITVDLNTDIFITGSFTGTAVLGNNIFTSLGNKDIFVLKLLPDSQIISAFTAGSGNVDVSEDIALDNFQNILVAGSYSNNIYINGNPYSSEGLTDGFVLKYKRLISLGEIEFSGIGCTDDNLCVRINMLQGDEPYNYYWSTGDTGEYVCGLAPASYSITVVDQNNCYIDTTLILPSVSMPETDLPASLNICFYDTVSLDAGPGMQLYEWSTSDVTQTILVSEAGVYSVTLTNNYECTLTASVNVTEGAPLELFGVDTIYTCVGNPVVLTLQGMYSAYLWSTGSVMSQATANSPGTYYVRVRLGQCYYYDTVRVQNYPQPEIDLGNDRVLCSGDFIYFEIEGDYSSYLWYDGSTESYFTCAAAGPVTITVVDINGCSASDSIYVNEGEYPEINLGPDLIYCDNLIPVIDAGEGFETYLWSDATNTQTISPLVSGDYSVTVTNETGCTAADTINVTVRPAPTIDLGEDVQTCDYNEVSLFAPINYASYLWNTGSTIPILNVDTTGVYSITVTDNYGCIAIDSVNVEYFEVLVPYLGPDKVVCDSVPYLLETDEDFEVYLWNNNSGDPSITAITPGTYSLTVTDINGCTSTDNINISHADSPVLTEIYSESGRIEVSSAGGLPPYIYSIDGMVWIPNGVFNNLFEDWYDVYVADSNSCTDTLKLYVDNNIQIPEYFTPNADGYNDTWEIVGIFRYPDADIMIFDRYGKKLAEYKGSQRGWDGIYARQQMPSDTYWYVIILNSDIATNKPFKGPVTIKR